MEFIVSFCMLSLLLIIGKVLRAKITLLQKLYLPSSVIAGILGLIIISIFKSHIPPDWIMGWNKLPGILINVVFATLFLGVVIPSLSTIWKKSGPQLAYGQIVAWGQYVVGTGLVIFMLRPLFDVSSLFGTIVPVGFEGGHGTAGGLSETFSRIGWPEGTDYALASATFGVIAAIITGMILINWAARNNILTMCKKPEELTPSELAGIYPENKRPSAGKQTVIADSIDTLAFHLAITGIAILIGYLIKQGLIFTEDFIPFLKDNGVMRSFPLFPICMIGGVMVQLASNKLAKTPPIDHQTMQRLGGCALDFLVVAAIATIRLEIIAHGIVPFLIIIAGGIIWNVFCVMWLAKRLLPDFWFERAIAEMGQSMGVTATGLLLLRVVDPESKSNAPSAFGYKQLLHEPFMGGGLWTSSAILLAWTWGPWFIFLVSIAAIIIWLLISVFLFKKS